jgi:hypothetical protein
MTLNDDCGVPCSTSFDINDLARDTTDSPEVKMMTYNDSARDTKLVIAAVAG